jgi:hypothetical protein
MPKKDAYVSIDLTAIALNDEESSDRRQAMGKDADVQTEKIVSEDADVQTELTAIMLDGEGSNFRRPIIGKDIGVQVNLTAITLADEQVNDQQHMMSQVIEINSVSPHIFNTPHLNTNGAETLGQSQATEPVGDSGNAQDSSMTKNPRVVEVVVEKPQLSTTNIINDIKPDLDPIVGYAQEPLLPLSKACTPLVNILHNLSFYVQMAIDETPEQPPDGLTIDESAAIRLYTIEWESPHRSLYSMLNRTLKKDDRENLRPYFKYMKLLLSALAKSPCVQSTVWRGVTKNASAEFAPGTSVTWWAFSSCTTALTVLENNMYLGTTGNRTLFSVEAINGRKVRAHSHFDTEDEILLLPGTHMIVQSQFSPAPDLHVIHLKQVIPEQVLLEPPFEGISHIVNDLF